MIAESFHQRIEGKHLAITGANQFLRYDVPIQVIMRFFRVQFFDLIYPIGLYLPADDGGKSNEVLSANTGCGAVQLPINRPHIAQGDGSIQICAGGK